MMKQNLIESATAMKPDHTFLTELPIDEAQSYMEAVKTGHEGCIFSPFIPYRVDAEVIK
ncbi:hypothetical protein Q4R69_17820 [Morganella morganii subsp. sibonii]